MFKFTNIVMLFRAHWRGRRHGLHGRHMGFGVMGNLVKLLLTLYAALIVFVLGVLLPIALIARLPHKALCPRRGRTVFHRLCHRQF